MTVATDVPDIVVFVKQARYDWEKKFWAYKVQEQDEKGLWCGREEWRWETDLKRA
jgi:hypothetical protein